MKLQRAFRLPCVLVLVSVVACHRRRHPPEPAPAASESLTVSLPSQRSAAGPTGVWWAPECAAPCCGGTSCAVSADNSERPGCAKGDSLCGCVKGEAACNRCPSEITCVPGGCGTELDAGETWELHASYLAGGDVTDTCSSPRRDTWACLRSGSSGEWSCLAMSETCGVRRGRGDRSVLVTTEDLTDRGIDIEIRDRGPNGPVLARRARARYATGLLRRALCTGLKFDGFTDVAGSGIDSFVYFLEPRSTDKGFKSR